MKRLSLMTISILFSFLAIGQSLQELNNRISELTRQKTQLESKLKQITSELNSLKKTKKMLIKNATSPKTGSINNFKVYSFIRIDNTPIFSSPWFMAKVLCRLKEKESVAVIGYRKTYWRIKYKRFVGYVPEASIEKLGPMNALKKVHGHIELLPERLAKGKVTNELMGKTLKRDKEENTRDNLKKEVKIQEIRKHIPNIQIERNKKRKKEKEKRKKKKHVD